jgi:hypothetical protein
LQTPVESKYIYLPPIGQCADYRYPGKNKQIKVDIGATTYSVPDGATVTVEKTNDGFSLVDGLPTAG